MGDELDDLFGAFDEQPQEKEEKRDTKTTEEEEEEEDEVPTEVIDSNKEKGNEPLSTSSNSSDTKNGATTSTKEELSKAFSSVMAAAPSTTTTSETKQQQQQDEKEEEEESKKNEKKDREISSGTSHDKSVRSYSAYPKNLPAGMEYKKKKSMDDDHSKEGPAKTYPFTLDPFQKEAIGYIEQEESVLVAAHTSAGKTAVAEYAIAKSLKAGQRVVYTSPIKALSNQKYRDLQEEFHNVGLMTGDITINPDATALVMTTEILRSMLYRGSELIKQVAWVIYDEVHYMRDRERGVVWEESIILLPHSVRFVFLSATIPNAPQFAEWIAHVHHQPCHVVYTNYRPVPLQHYIFPEGGDGLHLVVDERGKFREANFQKAMATLQSGGGNNTDAATATAMLESGNSRKRKRGASQRRGGGGLLSIVKLIMARNLNPVIVFSFSKRECERYALNLNKQDYNSDSDGVEKDLISQVYTNAMESLSEDDRNLPQVVALLPLLKRGIGIHHGGLLPILKEIVEILFSEGLIKVLFATETFSIGINMPAKTVVFTNTRKWDGKDFRWVRSGEYIQMSGRAGRRGKDDRGMVIQMVDEKMEPSVCKDMLYGDPDPLNSSYRISYNMLLNMMRVEDVDAEYLLRASFHQYQREKEVPGLLLQAQELEDEASLAVAHIHLSTQNATLVSNYIQIQEQLDITRRKMTTRYIQKPLYIAKFLNTPGRFVEIALEGESYGWGVVVSYRKQHGSNDKDGSVLKVRVLEVYLFCVERHFDTMTTGNDDNNNNNKATATAAAARKEDIENSNSIWKGTPRNCRPRKPTDDAAIVSLRIFTVGLDAVQRISPVRIFIPDDTRSVPSRKSVGYTIMEVQKRFNNGPIPLLDPIKDMGIQDKKFSVLVERAAELSKRLDDHEFLKAITDETQQTQVLNAYNRKASLSQQAAVIRQEARSYETIAMKADLKKMKKVLRQLGHVDANGVILTKGRTACEINTANELVVVELMFTGVFNDLTVEQSVALLSCMTFDEGGGDREETLLKLKSFLHGPFRKLEQVGKTVARAIIDCKMELDEKEFLEKFNPGMMEAVFAWCKGAKFVDVQLLTNSYEGTTIRTLRRLEELIRQISEAAKAIGNHEVQTKFEKGSELIKRDIVFCSSLYL